MDEAQLRSLSTGELIRHALEEARLLAKAEVLYAKQELREELKAAKLSGVLMGAGLVLALCALPVLFVAVVVALPIAEWLAALIVGVTLLVISGVCGMVGFKSLPRKPMPKTQERLKKDLTVTREQLA
jgi:uncharacterized membrane protein YqjE